MSAIKASPVFRLGVGAVRVDYKDGPLLVPKPHLWVSQETFATIQAWAAPSKLVEGHFILVKSSICDTFGRLLVERSSGTPLAPLSCALSSLLAFSLSHSVDKTDFDVELSLMPSQKPVYAQQVRLAHLPFNYSDSGRVPFAFPPTLHSLLSSQYLLPNTPLNQDSFIAVNWYNRVDLFRVVSVLAEAPSPILWCREGTQVTFTEWSDSYVSQPQPHAIEDLDESAIKKEIKAVVAGLDPIVDEMLLLWSAMHRSSTRSHGLPRGWLFVGPSGSGKTSLAQTFARLCGLNPILVNCPDLFSPGEGESELALERIFLAAKEVPSIIIMDEFDSIAQNRKNIQGAIEKRLLARLISLLDDFLGDSTFSISDSNLKTTSKSATSNRSLFIGIATSLTSLDPSLCRAHRLEKVFRFYIPSPPERLDILKTLTHKFPTMEDSTLLKLSQRTPGFSGSDLSNLCRHTMLLHLKQHKEEQDIPPIEWAAFEESLKTIRASSLSEYSSVPSLVSFDELRGMDDIIRTLKASVLEPFVNPERFQKLGAKPPSGVLLYGPPGVGKSKLALAIASSANVNFLSVNTTEILSKVVGSSEAALAKVFESARAAAPCILFLDQIDSIARERGRDSSEEQASDRILSLLLTEMDGIRKASTSLFKDVVIVLAATNKPHLLDSAVLRPGRFDEVLYIPPPDPSIRRAIIDYLVSRTPCAQDIQDSQIQDLVKLTRGYSGADLENLFREASFLALKRDIAADKLTWMDVQEAMKSVPASLLRSTITHPYNRKVGFTFLS